jgi:hypothetical protein
LRATRLVQRLEEHTGRRMLPAGRQALLERREIPLTQRDPYSYTADLSAADLGHWFGADAWQEFLDGRSPTGPGAGVPAEEAAPAVTVEEVLRHLAEERWDVDGLAAQLTDGQMRTLSPADRVRLMGVISGGFSVLNEDERTIVRLLATTPPEQARVVRDQLGTSLLQQLDGAIDFDDYRDYNDALRRLYFDSLTPDEAAEQMAGARVFPWANPGLIHALWNVRFYYEECELHDDGKVHVSYWINLAMFGLRTETVQLDPFEMIAVRFYYPEEHAGAEEGQTIYMPAINLRGLHRHQFKGELQTVVDVGLLAAGGAGLVGAGTRLARIVAALDLAVAAADITIRDFRHEIARTEHGRDFLAAWDAVSTLIAAYGVARLAMHAPAAIRRLRSTFERFRAVSPPLPADTMRRIESEVDDVLHQADEAEEAAAAAGASGSPGQTSGAGDAVDSATGQTSTGRADAGDAARLDDSADTARLDDTAAAARLTSVPGVRDGAFARWFNELTVDEFERVWANPRLRRAIESRLRHPGGMHEWHLVSRANVFKRWGVTAEQIIELRTAINEVRFVNPSGHHGGLGSATAHNELLGIIDSSNSYADFVRRLQSWALNRLEGGVNALPPGLRP